MGKSAKIVVLGGDGIGLEVTAVAVDALKAVAKKCGHSFEFENHLFGSYLKYVKVKYFTYFVRWMFYRCP
eukprot:m.120253 g.120253  ORF g.120253 m.120253 type:complete len:70 (+) comp14351_c0_seq4:100-309(+)